MRESMVFYKSFLASIRLLPKKHQLQFYNALFDYGFDGVAPKDLPGGAAALFNALKPQIDANNRKYENGKKGGRPPKNQGETKPKPNDNQTETKPKPNEYANANATANEDVDVNEDVNANATANAKGSSSVDDYDLWKKMDPDMVDAIYDVYPNTGGILINEVHADVKAKKKTVRDPVAFILGYARHVAWDDNKEIEVV